MRQLVAIAGVSFLTACAGPSGEVYRSYSEAGGILDGGSFGAADTNNRQIMSGEKVFAIDLSNRFATEVMTTVNFAFNSARLDAGARDTLREQAAWIKQFPEVRFRVYGHTDAVGSTAYNKRLGLRRARAVVSYLASQGISRNRLEAVVSFGETQPLIVAQERERRNRRTVTEVSGFLKSHPVIMDGRYAEVVYRETIESAKPDSDLKMVTGGGATTGEGGE